MIPRHRPGPAALSLLLAGAVLAAGCGPAAQVRAPVSFPEGWPYPADAPAVTADSGAVVTTDAYATDVGVEILRAGGNAVDAAVAVSFALAVVNPQAGNLGGGGFMVARLSDGTEAALDYREKAPLAATRDMFLDEAGNLTDRSVVGHLASGVPGTVMGMWEAHQRFGALPWEDLVGPAVELAESFVVRPRQHRMFTASEEGLRRFEATATTFLPGGQVPQVGDTFRQPDLAGTLRRIRDRGADGFYRGETADLIVAEMERGGGIISHEDLQRYDVAWRDPLVFEYREHTLLSMPPSSSGGATMAEAANILEGYSPDTLAWHSAVHVHLLAEAWKRAYADRNTYLADTAFVDVPLEAMISPAYAAERRAEIRLDRATPSDSVEPGLGSEPEPRAVTGGQHTT
ncbi:MAG: gamma-glutamyltransferase, partial [Gemmatimonadetes bacterium]|nr:gamma-glutamyltransferase family protein [Gemmatimonadota bacterium]NIR79757.1 gamma-glutamyltransferase family protein [Gemmatimonadota bacterium]NIT88453.1 gamma-glutamyltransferase family protein [Gemmatimonadota bacterium]NIU32276.1 gamma-glutamyltransferase family protein [Gemmatimonadota bacterium]NIU36817.1 gamma-glutamyltransferase [Gemmatimonadota bacterium]